jgi:hypothetical protein
MSSWDAPLEKDIEEYLVRQARKIKALCYKFTAPGRRSVPDRILLIPGGRMCFVECKRPGGKPTPLQQQEHEKLRERGFRVYLVDTWAEVDRVIALEGGG